MAANPQVACLRAPPRSPAGRAQGALLVRRPRVGVPDSSVTSFEPPAGHRGRRPRDRRDRPGRLPAFPRRHRPLGQPAYDDPAGPPPPPPPTLSLPIDTRTAPSPPPPPPW